LLIHVLGPMEIHQAGEYILTPSERSILAALALNPQIPVATARLSDWLWRSERYPLNPSAALQTYVSRLRNALTSTDLRISTLPDAYMLEADPLSIDAHHFEQLTFKALGTRDESMLGEALGLWRGAPLCDIPATDPVEAACSKLTEMYLQLAEAYNDILIANGYADRVIGELRRLVEEFPYREHFSFQLMTCLAEVGGKAEALHVYREVYRRFRDELGVEPGEDLRELHLKILRNNHGRARPPRSGVGSPTTQEDSGPYTPRPLTWIDPGEEGMSAPEVIADSLQYSSGRRISLTVISGPPGSGTTTAALQYAWAYQERYPDGVLFVDLAAAHQSGDQFGVPIGPAPALSLRVRVSTQTESSPDARALTILDGARSVRQLRPWVANASGAVLVTSSSQLHGLPNARLLRMRTPSVRRAAELLTSMLSALPEADISVLERLAVLCDRNLVALAATAGNLQNRIYSSPTAAVDALAVEPVERVAELECGELSIVKSFLRALDYRSDEEMELLHALAASGAELIGEQEARERVRLPEHARSAALRGLVEANLIFPAAKPGQGKGYRISPLCSGIMGLIGAG
jgi:DNA-binding SARP family transcriptional activator